MMQILSHRGFWKTKEEQNTAIAFRRSFENGFGVETDIRDCGRELVISHDMPDGSQIKLDEFFEIYNSYQLSIIKKKIILDYIEYHLKSEVIVKQLIIKKNYH